MNSTFEKTLEAVISYRRFGFYSVPIPHKEKGPKTKGWNQQRLEVSDLRQEFGHSPRNNGLLLGEPSRGLTNVDKDCPETVALAPEFLPPTQRKSGRESRPLSHSWYISPGSRSKRYEDTEGNVLVEIRSTGGQTLAPPSVHPSGEACVWHEEGEFSAVDPDILQEQVAQLAATALLARHWPTPGSRHKGTLAIAGLLLRGGLGLDLVKKIVSLAARTAGDEESASRITDVETTADRLQDNLPATGGPTAVELFGSPVIQRVSDWLKLKSGGGTKSGAETANEGGSSQVDRLEDLAVDEVSLFHSPDEKTYVTYRVDDHHETWSIGSKRFRRWLSRRYSEKCSKRPSRTALDDAVSRLEERALAEGEQLEVYVRVACHEGAIYLDLGTPDWNAVEITGQGWRIRKDPPVKFRRSNGMLPLPIPEDGGTIDELRRFINYGTEENWFLIASFLLATFRPQGPHPVLALFGEQGSAKSTTASVIRRLVDPHEADRRTQPKDLQDLFIAAKNSWILNYDNLSYIDQALSDAFCQIATGGAMSKRALYTDDGEYIARFQRPIIINGIEEVMTRSDLMDRSIVLSLPVIPEEDRRSEASFWEDFRDASPRILGAILNIVSDGLRRLPTVDLPRKPRMADFAIWATACESKLGLKDGAFMAAYHLNRDEVHQMALASSPVGQAVQDLVAQSGKWRGTATELLATLNILAGADRSARGWPQNAQKLSGQLTRLTPNLRALGIEVGKGKKDRNTRLITIKRVG